MLLDAIVSLGGMILPPVFDFIKKKFIKNADDTPEATMSTLATTSPGTLPAYVEAVSKYTNAQKEYFNRDVVGNLPEWVSALRATIRPVVVIIGLAHITLHGIFGNQFVMDPGTKLFYEGVIASWFGNRLTKD